MNYISEICCRV